MGDSDDEYDRKRRDKFRGERSSNDNYRSDRRDDRRGREDWGDRYHKLLYTLIILCIIAFEKLDLLIDSAISGDAPDQIIVIIGAEVASDIRQIADRQ